MTDKGGGEHSEQRRESLKLLLVISRAVKLCQKNVAPSFFFSPPPFILYGSVTAFVTRLMGWGSRPGPGVQDIILRSPPRPSALPK